MGVHLLTVAQARAYLRDEYGVTWSGVYIRRLARDGKLDGRQPSGPYGHWLISRESIDELFAPRH
jgi:hypothetical protein